MNKLKKFEIWSALGTIIFGSMLHFAFEWSGGWKPLALIAAVNESTWEHLKIAFWPAFIFAATAYLVFARKERNFCFAQMKKLFLIPFLIVILFYGWLHYSTDDLLYDIIIFIVAIIIGHLAAWLFEKSKWQLDNYRTFAAIVITLLLLAFSLLTYFPPKNFLFRDPVKGGYGIEIPETPKIKIIGI